MSRPSKFWDMSPAGLGERQRTYDDDDDDIEMEGRDGDDTHCKEAESAKDIKNEKDGKSGDVPSDDPNLSWEKIKQQQLFLPVTTTENPAMDPATDARQLGVTRFVVISDTHGKHRQLYLPPGNILIHGGDFTKTGELGTIEDLSSFFGDLLLKEDSNESKNHTEKYRKNYYESIICIAGNHDMSLDTDYYLKEDNWYKGTLPSPDRRRRGSSGHRNHPTRFQQRKEDAVAAQNAIRKNCHYLNDTSYIIKKNTTEESTGSGNGTGGGGHGGGIVVYGSPWSPVFYHWGFNAERGEEINKIWAQIPDETDILVTHGPPLGRGDRTPNGRAGCYDLLRHIQERIRPRVSIFGHIHEGYGVEYDGRTLYINGSNCNLNYEVYENLPAVFDLPHDKTLPARIVKPRCQIHSIRELVKYCNDINLPELANGLKKCEDNKSGRNLKIPLGNDLLDLENGIPMVIDALRQLDIDGMTLTSLIQQLIVQFRPRLYADSFQ